MKINRVLIGLVSLLLLCAFLFTLFYREAKQQAVDNLNVQQALHAKQAARGIEDFFTLWKGILTVLSESRHIINLDQNGREDIGRLYTANREKIRGITRVDASGRIVYTIPYDGNLIGRDISSQKHVQEVMRTRKPAISDVFTAVQGYQTVALHVPVFGRGIYKGTIAVVVDFQSLARRYLEEIKIGKTGYAWMTSRDGTELYCPVPGHTGKSVYINCKDFPSILAMAGEMLKGHQGVTTYTFDMIGEQTVRTVKKHAVYMPVSLGNTFWSIVVASSEAEVLASLSDFRNRLILVISLFLLGTVLFSYYGLKARFIIKEQEKRLKVEAALMESEERFRTLSEKSPLGMSLIGADGRYEYVNPAFVNMFGYGLSDIATGKEWFDTAYPDPEYREEVMADWKKDLDGDTKHEIRPRSYEVRCKRGDVRTILFWSVTLPSGKQLVIYEDITDHKRAEEKLRESEERYRSILENIEEGYFEIDLAGNMKFFNPPLCRILGYPKEEMLGMNNRVYMDAENAKKVFRAFNDIYVTGIPAKGFEWETIKKDGTRTHMEVSVSLITGPEEKPTGFRGITRDVTERKAAEEEKRVLQERLQRSEKMEALGTLAGGVAHDLNNVLGVIVGYSEMTLDQVDKSSPLRHGLENIMNGGLKAAAIVDDLLTLARRGVHGRSILNLNMLVADCQKSPEFANLSSHHPSVNIKTDLETDLLNISGSSVHLGKSLYNLISNASEAMTKGGTVTIKTTNQYLEKPIQGYDRIREGDYVVLSVSDTGEGISANDLKRIFEPFYTKKIMGRSGTGLGLAVVWGTVKDHNGYINVQSEEAKGSTFTLYFPVTREEITAEASTLAVSEYMGKGETILVVDDIKEQRDLAASILKALHYSVSTVSSGEEAVEYAKEREVDLLVLDMIMDPGMDGLDTYRSILNIRPKQKAIIVSGFSESDRVRAAKGLGVGAYVRKPYVKEKLGLAVRNELVRK